MSAHACPKCGELRKVDIIHTSDGWDQPPCYHCGDPGYLEPHEKIEGFDEAMKEKLEILEVDDSVFQEILKELPERPKLWRLRDTS